jgi:hypothetical protein
MDFEQEDKGYLILSRTYSWLHGVILQADRILTYDEKFATTLNYSTKEMRDLRIVSPIEDHFFAIAVNKSIEYLLEAEKMELIARGTSKKYRKDADKGRQLRNMLEHDLNYLSEKGRQQDNYIHINNSIACDASSKIIIDGEHNLGGRLKVKETAENALEILPIVRENLNSYFTKP